MKHFGRRGVADLSYSQLIKIILTVLTTISLLFIALALYKLYGNQGDPNTVALDVMVGEIEFGIDYLERYEQKNEYFVVFPLSMATGYYISAYCTDSSCPPDDKSTTLFLNDADDTNVEKSPKLKKTAVIFSETDLKPSNGDSIRASNTLLRNYGLHITRDDDRYTVRIVYCRDVWCDGLKQSVTILKQEANRERVNKFTDEMWVDTFVDVHFVVTGSDPAKKRRIDTLAKKYDLCLYPLQVDTTNLKTIGIGCPKFTDNLQKKYDLTGSSFGSYFVYIHYLDGANS